MSTSFNSKFADSNVENRALETEGREGHGESTPWDELMQENDPEVHYTHLKEQWHAALQRRDRVESARLNWEMAKSDLDQVRYLEALLSRIPSANEKIPLLDKKLQNLMRERWKDYNRRKKEVAGNWDAFHALIAEEHKDSGKNDREIPLYAAELSVPDDVARRLHYIRERGQRGMPNDHAPIEKEIKEKKEAYDEEITRVTMRKEAAARRELELQDLAAHEPATPDQRIASHVDELLRLKKELALAQEIMKNLLAEETTERSLVKRWFLKFRHRGQRQANEKEVGSLNSRRQMLWDDLQGNERLPVPEYSKALDQRIAWEKKLIQLNEAQQYNDPFAIALKQFIERFPSAAAVEQALSSTASAPSMESFTIQKRILVQHLEDARTLAAAPMRRSGNIPIEEFDYVIQPRLTAAEDLLFQVKSGDFQNNLTAYIRRRDEIARLKKEAAVYSHQQEYIGTLTADAVASDS